MKDECKAWLRKEINDAVERVIAELEAHPVYYDDGEESTLTIRMGFSGDQNKQHSHAPSPDDEGTYINLSVTFAKTETR